MDPLSVIASIIAILQLTSKVLSYLNDVEESSKEHRQCTIEAANLYGLLTSLKFLLEDENCNHAWFRSVKTLNTPNGPLDQFKEALLEIEAKLIGTGTLRSTKIGKKVLWRFTKKETTSILLRIERLKTLVQIALEMDHFKLTEAINRNVDALQLETRKINDKTQVLLQAQESRDYDAMLNWISQSNYPQQQSDHIFRRQEGTGEWFLTSQLFKDWCSGRSRGSTLFCPGIPGSGKTMISAIAIDHLLKSTNSDEIGVAYIFCHHKSQADQDSISIFSSILKQLVQMRPGIAAPARKLFELHVPRRTTPSFAELFDALEEVVESLSKVYIVIDALDEYYSHSGTRDHTLTHFRKLQESRGVNLMCTSRWGSDFEPCFSGAPTQEIRATEYDIKKFLAGQANSRLLPKCIMTNEELLLSMELTVAEAVDGMFLLARLYVDSLRDKHTVKAVKQSIRQFSQDLSSRDYEKIYDREYDGAMRRIENQLPGDHALATSILSFIALARRQLTISELQHALAVEAGAEDIDIENICDIEDAISKCAGLVMIDYESSIVRLAHYTLQDYLERNQDRWFPHAKFELALKCLTYLSFQVFQDGCCLNEHFVDRKQQYPLLTYAAEFWGYHAQKAKDDNEIEQCVMSFLADPQLISTAVQAVLLPELPRSTWFWPCSDDWKGLGPLHFTSMMGLETFAEKLFTGPLARSQPALNELDHNGNSSLWYAADRGHVDIGDWLLQNGASVDLLGSNGTPLQRAALQGHKDFIQVLINHGSDIHRNGRLGHALSIAAQAGKDEVVKTLLKNGFDVNAIGSRGRALERASETGHGQTVKLLLDHGADANAPLFDGPSDVPLVVASRAGQKKIVKLLLERGAKPDARGLKYNSPLCAATLGGHRTVARLLIRHGADVNKPSPGRYGTPLHVAAVHGDERMVRFLVRRGANVDAISGYYGSVLNAAVEAGHLSLVKLLIRQDANVNPSENGSTSPLERAMREGHADIAYLLLNHGADLRSFKCDMPLVQPLFDCSSTNSKALYVAWLHSNTDSMHRLFTKLIRETTAAQKNSSLVITILSALRRSDQRIARLLVGQRPGSNEASHEAVLDVFEQWHYHQDQAMLWLQTRMAPSGRLGVPAYLILSHIKFQRSFQRKLNAYRGIVLSRYADPGYEFLFDLKLEASPELERFIETRENSRRKQIQDVYQTPRYPHGRMKGSKLFPGPDDVMAISRRCSIPRESYVLETAYSCVEVMGCMEFFIKHKETSQIIRDIILYSPVTLFFQ